MFWQWREREWLVWTGWTATYGLGWFVSITVFLASAMLLSDNLGGGTSAPPPGDNTSLTLVLATIWGLVGLGQWVLMFVYLHRTSWRVPWWVLTYIIGWSFLWLLTNMHITGFVIPHSRLPVVWVLGSAGIVVLQWLVFRKNSLKHADRWLVSYPAALVATLLICWGLDQSLQQITATAASRAFTVVVLPGIIYGAITGLVLIDLCRYADQNIAVNTRKEPESI